MTGIRCAPTRSGMRGYSGILRNCSTSGAQCSTTWARPGLPGRNQEESDALNEFPLSTHVEGRDRRSPRDRVVDRHDEWCVVDGGGRGTRCLLYTSDAAD